MCLQTAVLKALVALIISCFKPLFNVKRDCKIPFPPESWYFKQKILQICNYSISDKELRMLLNLVLIGFDSPPRLPVISVSTMWFISA